MYWTILTGDEPTEVEAIRLNAGCPALVAGGVTVGKIPLTSAKTSMVTITREFSVALAPPADTPMPMSPSDVLLALPL
jgi:hypothetical protein